MKFTFIIALLTVSSSGFAQNNHEVSVPKNACQVKAIDFAKQNLLNAGLADPFVIDILQTPSAVLIRFTSPSLDGSRNPGGIVDTTVDITKSKDGDCQTSGRIATEIYDDWG